jgi:ATP-dependent exoDNAse (exonuclease V) alpha subunit
MSSHLKALQEKMAALRNSAAPTTTVQAGGTSQSHSQTVVQAPTVQTKPAAKVNPALANLLRLKEIQAKVAAAAQVIEEIPQAPAQKIAPAPTVASIVQAIVTEDIEAEMALPNLPAVIEQKAIELNERQQQAVAMALEGEPFCLIGSAGTGKTTTEKEIVRAVATRLRDDHVYIDGEQNEFTPSNHIIVCAFTRRAVRNIVKAVRSLGAEYTACCKTVHKALKYKPVKEEYLNAEGQFVERKIYKPHVTKEMPDYDVKTIIVDEASMLGYSKLYRELREGFPEANFIFIGDLNQLRPVMDQPTLAYALACVPVVELNHVYRQALDSPIVEFQYTFTLAGKVPKFTDLMAYNNAKRGLHFQALNWPKLQDQVKYTPLFVKHFVIPSYNSGTYKPEEAVFLIPYRKAGTFGSVELNLEIAEFLGQQREAVVHEVIAGFQKRYFATGDLVMYDRKEYKIIDIAINTQYKGRQFLQASKTLSRHGYYLSEDDNLAGDIFAETEFKLTTEDLLAIEFESDEEDEEAATRKSSHSITLEDRDTGDHITVEANKDILEIEFSYALTIHQSQGSEWKKVYLIMHASHKNVTREMLYTGMTRAREELVVFYSKGYSLGTDISNSSLAKAIDRQEIAGLTWQEKALVYKMSLNNGNGDLPVDMDWFMNISTEEDKARYKEFARLRDDEYTI